MAAESVNKVKIVGKLVEISHKDGTNRNGQEYIAGKVMIETEPDNIIPIDFYQNVLKKDGNPNNVHKGIMTMINEFKTVAKDGKEAADVVEVDAARLEENSFYAQGGAFVRGFRTSAPFFNRRANAENENSFITTGIVLNMVDEIKNDVPTGSLFVDLLVIGYGNRGDVIRYTVEDEKGVSYLKNSLSNGDEVKFAGKIVIKEERVEKVEESAFGGPIVEFETKFKRELLVTSATPSTAPSISSDEIETILAAREGRMAQSKADAEARAKSNSGNNGATPKRNFSL